MSTNSLLKSLLLSEDLRCYLAAEPTVLTLPLAADMADDETLSYRALLQTYQLPLGTLNMVTLTLYLPAYSSVKTIDAKRMVMTKAALAWHKQALAQTEADTRMHHLFIMDIQLFDQREISEQLKRHTDFEDIDSHHLIPYTHSFGAPYFIEDLVVDLSEDAEQLTTFSLQDWQAVLAMLKTPGELWRFLDYYGRHMQRAAIEATDYESEAQVLANFMADDALFASAITIDNALINYDMQDKPNPALITMKLAQKSQSKHMAMYQRHMQQAATVWSELIAQVLITIDDDNRVDKRGYCSLPRSLQWQRQLLDESLFSRHELVRTIYNHRKQEAAVKQSGYVVHQHSYEHLGRHYVMVFYGDHDNAQQSKRLIQPKLDEIAIDVSTRLPLVELDHVIVMGIDFVTDDEGDDTFIDIDLWIQPITATTQKERQLTQQLQKLKPQTTPRDQAASSHNNAAEQSQRATSKPSASFKTLSSMTLDLSIDS